MKIHSTTDLGRPDHPPQPSAQTPPQRVGAPSAAPQTRRVGALDRAALHLGVALIKWGRRPKAAPTREARLLRAEQQTALLARRREAERELRLTIPPR